MAIQELHENNGFSFTLLCEVTGIVRSSYYKWLHRKPTVEEKQNKKLLHEIYAMHKAYDGIFGSPHEIKR